MEFVPIKNIINGALASLRQNITVAINVESAQSKSFESNVLLEDPDLKEYISNGSLKIINGLWISFIKNDDDHELVDNNSKKIKNFIHNENYNRCRNIFNSITIDPNHRLLSCCGITAKRIKYLDLGDTREYGIKELYDRQFNDFMKIWISTEGTHKIMDFISSFTSVDASYKIEHPCKVCEKILSNIDYLTILKNNYKEIYSNILLKYFINKKEYQYETSR